MYFQDVFDPRHEVSLVSNTLVYSSNLSHLLCCPQPLHHYCSHSFAGEPAQCSLSVNTGGSRPDTCDSSHAINLFLDAVLICRTC